MKSELEEEFQKWLKQNEPWGHYYSGDTISKWREIFYAGAQAQDKIVSELSATVTHLDGI